MQLLNPIHKQPKKGGGKKNLAPLSPGGLKESYDLLDCMDDLLLQITILRERITALQKVSTTRADAAENDELLDCLRVVGTHINKHKDILENGQALGGRGVGGGKRPSHVSILESAQTWRLTLLSVISALSRRSRAETVGETRVLVKRRAWK